MLNYLGKRLLMLIPVMLGVSILAFMLIHFIPGDPAVVILGEKASPQALAELRQQLGLNDPLYIQYFKFMNNILHGDMGRSIITHNPVSEELSQRFPATIELTLAAMLLAVVIGVAAGVISAVKQYSWFDNVSMFGALFGVSMPIFWLGLMLILIFSNTLHWLPPSARINIEMNIPTVTNFILIDSLLAGNIAAFIDALKHLILPSIALATIPMAIIARMTRSSMLEIMKQDFIRTANAKGLGKFMIIMKHALKNAFLPVITVVGLQFGQLLGGAVLTESIFSWPGIGRYMYQAIMARDFPVVQGGILFIALIFVFVNLLVDITYTLVDPRIRYQ